LLAQWSGCIVAKRKSYGDDSPVKGGDSIVSVARQRYERAKSYYDRQRILSIEDTRFVMGDSDNQWQWPQDVWRQRATIDRKPCLTINVTAQHCNQVINQIRQNRPSAKISPVDDFADIETAKIIGGMLRAIQRVSDADTAHDLGAEFALYGGEGYWRVITEYEDPTSFDQVIRIKPITDPNLVYLDPASKEPDRSDAQWGFVFEDISRDQCKQDHPDCDPESWIEDSRTGWVTRDTIRRAEYFWCEFHDDVLYLLEDGTTAMKSEVEREEGYSVVMYGEGADAGGAIMAGDVMTMGIVFKRPTKRKQWKWCKLLGGEEKPIEERDWPGQYLPIITVVGKELNVNGEVVRKGIVRDLKDPARMVNYSYSAAVEGLALQNKVPYVASAEAIEGFEDIWGSANIDNRAYLPFNAFDDQGNQLPRPERQAPQQVQSAQVQMLALSVEQMRAASGQQNSNFGIKSEASSGIGIQRLKQQGEIATFHFPDNLSRALKYEGKVIVDLIPKVYESKRVIRILGLDGEEDAAVLDPQLSEPFAELKSKVDKIFNPGVGKYDVAIDTGPSYQTQRQESADFIRDAVSASPELLNVAGDLVWKAMDFPMAEEFSERFKKLPSIAALVDQEDEGAEVPPQVQAQMQQMQEQMQAMQEAGAELQTENEQLKASDQAKMMTAERDAQLKQQAAAQQAEIDRQKMLMDAQQKREQAEIDAQVEIEKARIANETKLRIAAMDNDTAVQIAAMQSVPTGKE
jgi:hypothetical protein